LRQLILAFAVVALAGCPAPDPSTGLATTAPPAQVLDYNDFVCKVQPVLVRHCSFIGCHGNPDHALRIYSPGKLRLVDTGKRADRDAKLTADEVMRNFESATGTVYAASPADRQAPNDHVPLLAKPARASVGGSEHHGVGIFPVFPATTLDQDPEWGALADWVAGKKVAANALDADCTAMFMKLGLQPQ
jgi:hypothetical protein